MTAIAEIPLGVGFNPIAKRSAKATTCVGAALANIAAWADQK